MKATSSFRSGLLALLAATSLAPYASAQAEPDPDPGTTFQSACIAEDDGFKLRGGKPVFEIALQNKCNRRISCRVFVFITTAKGMSQGDATLVLAPSSAGAAAKSSYVLAVKMTSGNSQSTRECRVVGK